MDRRRKRSLADFSLIPSSLATASNFGQGKNSDVSCCRFPKEEQGSLEGRTYVDVGLAVDVSHQKRQEVGLGLVQGCRFFGACHLDGTPLAGLDGETS
jgi:hypothetical protein